MTRKMRVFELAKELSLDPKDLLRIAKDLAISVDTAMSVIDGHDVERIKKRLERETQKKEEEETRVQEVYEEKRVSTTVIRRRAKAVPTPPPTQAQGPEPAAEETQAAEHAEQQASPPATEKAPDGRKAVKKKEPAKKESPREVLEAPAGAEPKDEAGAAERAEKAQPVPAAPRSEGEETAAGMEPSGARPVSESPRGVVSDKVETITVSLKEELKDLVKKEAPKETKKKEKKKGKRPIKIVALLEEEGGIEEEPAPVEAEAPVVVDEVKAQEQPGVMEVYTQTDLYGPGKIPGTKRPKKKKDRRGVLQAQPERKKRLRIGDTITVANLAKEMGLKVSEVIKTLMNLGVMASQNQYISSEEAILAASELGFEVEETKDTIHEAFFAEPVYGQEALTPRPPVVTVMGHVDHGKTSLLDAIRSENVIDSEFGGITQHIGAYQAHCKERLITFIDTPGHEAFTSMRSRGAQVTDFVVLVVAADDGVMDQTKEAISHARAAGIPILVAVNKIDKPNANPLRVREQLAEMGLVPEEWGGDTIYVDVSAKKHQGIEELLEMILLQADMMDLKARLDGPARGVVLESKLDKNRGPMCTLLIQQGELKKGDVFVVGSRWGKARAMYDFRGRPLDSAGPATPVEIIGLAEPPSAGDTMFVVPSEKKAKEVIEYLQNKEVVSRLQAPEQKVQVTLEDLYNQVREGKIKDLNLIVKGDVHGTVEAIVNAIRNIDTSGHDIRINVLHYAVGGITENDVLLASTSAAIIIGFNVRPEAKARDLAKKNNVDIKLYTVIYDLIDDIKQALRGMLEPVFREVVQGRAEVRETFKVPKVGVIAGCLVTEGSILRGASVRLLRDNVVVHEGRIESLKRFKDDAKEVQMGYECGIGLGGYSDIKVGDVIEAFSKEKVEAESTW